MSELEYRMQIDKCEHEIIRNLPCIRCREALSWRRLAELEGRTGRIVEYEREMHEHDIKLFHKMLARGQTTLS